MFRSIFVGNSEAYLKDAISNGISSEAIVSSLNSIINKSNSTNKTPKQIYKVVAAIALMKMDTSLSYDMGYKSNLFKSNNSKIYSALRDGILPSEVFKTLNIVTNDSYDKKRKKGLRFVSKLIVKMKSRELNLSKTNNKKSYQKVLTQ